MLTRKRLLSILLSWGLPMIGFAQETPAVGAWWEQVRALPASSTAEERAQCMDTHGAPQLAVLRELMSAEGMNDPVLKMRLCWALAEEQWSIHSEAAARLPRPAASDLLALLEWLFLNQQTDAALELAAQLPAEDASPRAVVLRTLTAAYAEWVEDELFEQFTQARPNVTGAALALAGEAENRLRMVAARKLELLELANSAGEEYECPLWVERSIPSEEVVIASTRCDPAECQRLLAEVQTLPFVSGGRDEQALRSLELACAADVLAAQPHFQLARWRNLRGERHLALAAIDSGLRRDPQSAEGWMLRAVTSDIVGDTRATLLAAERGLECAPGDPLLEAHHVRALVRLGQLAEARQAAAELRLSSSENPWPVIADALLLLSRDGPMQIEQQARDLESSLEHLDDYARLWSAVTLACTRGRLDGRVATVLLGLEQQHAGTTLGEAARAMNADDPQVALWGGFARLARGDAAGAAQRWLQDASGSGELAIAARGMLNSFQGERSWPSRAELPAFAPEQVVPLPDPSALSVRVPSEARDIAQALAVLPKRARKVVLGRGLFHAPEQWTRAADLIGLGLDTQVQALKGKQGSVRVLLNAPECLRVAELHWDAFLKIDNGQVQVRRVESTGSWWIGDYQREGVQARAWFADVVFREGVRVDGARSWARFDQCSFVNPLANSEAVRSFLGQVELFGCTVQQGQPSSAIIACDGEGAKVTLQDCRLVGHARLDRKPASAVVVDRGARARLLRTRIVDLEPCSTPACEAQDCHFQRTKSQQQDLPGWTAHGRAPSALATPLPVLRVPEDQPTLNQAIAQASAGQTIQLSAGVHPLEVDITRDVQFLGAGNQRTLIQTAPYRDSLVIQGAHVWLQELSVVGHELKLQATEQGWRVESGARPSAKTIPTLVRIADGALRFGSNVWLQDPRGLRFEIGPGGCVSGFAGVWLLNPEWEAQIVGDGLLACSIDLSFQRWTESAVDWRPQPLTVHRPLHLALDSNPLAALQRTRVQRVQRLDALLARYWPKAGTAFLADCLHRIYALTPEAERQSALQARLSPRLAELAQKDARAGVEELIAIAMAGVGGSSVDEVLSTTRWMVQTFLKQVPPEHKVYVEARLQGKDAIHADQVARRALCLEARDAGRLEQCLALVDSVDPVTRAEVLLTTEPDRLTYSQVAELLKTPELFSERVLRRLKILQQSFFAISPTGPPALPGFLALYNAYTSAYASGVGNQYFGFRDRDVPGVGWRSEVVLRPEYVPGNAPLRPAKPKPPAVGSKDAAWDQFYTELEAWSQTR